MYSYFTKYGEVESVEILYYRGTHRNRGFGFVVFKSSNDAFEAVNNTPHVIKNKMVEAKYAIPKKEIESSPSWNHEKSELQKSCSMNSTTVCNENQLSDNEVRNQSISAVDNYWNSIS